MQVLISYLDLRDSPWSLMLCRAAPGCLFQNVLCTWPVPLSCPALSSPLAMVQFHGSWVFFFFQVAVSQLKKFSLKSLMQWRCVSRGGQGQEAMSLRGSRGQRRGDGWHDNGAVWMPIPHADPTLVPYLCPPRSLCSFHSGNQSHQASLTCNEVCIVKLLTPEKNWNPHQSFCLYDISQQANFLLAASTVTLELFFQSPYLLAPTYTLNLRKFGVLGQASVLFWVSKLN